MKRILFLSLIAMLALSGCRALAGSEINDNPRITPTSMTGVTSANGTNVYAKIPSTTTSQP